MTIRCRHCDQPFDSLIVDRQLAFKQLNDELMKHSMRKHPDAFKAVGAVIMAITGFIALRECAIIPDTEEWLVGQMEETQDKIMSALGFDAVEEPTVEVVETPVELQ